MEGKGGGRSETDFSTSYETQKKTPWLSEPFEIGKRPADTAKPEKQGSETNCRMKERRFRFPKNIRLQKAWQFDRLFRTGRRNQGRLVRLLFISAPDGTRRIGVAVGKRQGDSPARNRGRRVLKEALRRLLPWMRNGYWVVFTLKTSGLDTSARDVYFDSAQLMKRAGLLREDWPGPDWETDRRRMPDETAC
jgi:ribonuclease P protein component